MSVFFNHLKTGIFFCSDFPRSDYHLVTFTGSVEITYCSYKIIDRDKDRYFSQGENRLISYTLITNNELRVPYPELRLAKFTRRIPICAVSMGLLPAAYHHDRVHTFYSQMTNYLS